MKTPLILSFLCGAALMIAFNTIGGSKPSQHVYELRMYHVNAGKMDALVARFGDHTDAIFKRYNMKSIGYWVPEDAPHSQDLFIYVLEHPSREEAKKNWADFQADPEWKKVKAESETEGPLANHIDSYFMDPTSYSALNQQQEMPKAQVHILEAGHFALDTKADEIADLIRDFMKQRR